VLVFLSVLKDEMTGWDTVFVVPPYNRCVKSGMFIPDPDFYLSRIPDPKTAMKDRGEKKISFSNLFLSHQNFTNFIFKMLNKKIWANFQRIKELFTQKLSLSSQKYGFGIRDRDPGSGKNLFRIPDSKRHRIPDPDPLHCI
jgi:hypothetical protein